MGRSEAAGRRISRRRFLAGAGSTVLMMGLGACGPQQQSSEPAPTEGVPEMPDQAFRVDRHIRPANGGRDHVPVMKVAVQVKRPPGLF